MSGNMSGNVSGNMFEGIFPDVSPDMFSDAFPDIFPDASGRFLRSPTYETTREFQIMHKKIWNDQNIILLSNRENTQQKSDQIITTILRLF